MSQEDVITIPPSDHKRKLDKPLVESNGQDDPDVKRHRFDDNNNTTDTFGEGTENGHHEEKEEEPEEDVTEELKEDSVADENGEVSVKEEVQEHDAAPDVVSQGDVSGWWWRIGTMRKRRATGRRCYRPIRWNEERLQDDENGEEVGLGEIQECSAGHQKFFHKRTVSWFEGGKVYLATEQVHAKWKSRSNK
ncbi:hypothetical protein Tco_1070121 [Tanacetum coccineum]|uniref:Uncharacterized protein n=1 Tax=Tanacetum coccineum TaxID=301880 RepID=A0ABQ5HKS7_9ASTR